MNEYNRRMAHPAARAAVAKVRARHARIDAAKRCGAVSDEAEARTSKFGKVVTPEMAASYQARGMSLTSPNRKLPVAHLVVVLRRVGDELDAGLNAAPDHASTPLVSELQRTPAAKYSRRPQHSGQSLGDILSTALSNRNDGREAAGSGGPARSGDTWSSASGI
jgi:hypothetical protein